MNVHVIKFVAIIVLATKSTYCLVPRNGDFDYGSSKTVPLSLKQQQPSPFELNDRPVYDPGVGKSNPLAHFVSRGSGLIVMKSIDDRTERATN